MTGLKSGLSALALATVAALGLSSASQASYLNNIYTAGHADIGVAYDGSALDLHYHFGANAVINGAVTGMELEVAPDQVTTIVAGPSFPRPAGATWDFIGNTAGDPIWLLPQANDPAKPFVGLASEELDPSEWVGGMTWALGGVTYTGSGDGKFSLWQTDIFGSPVVKWSEASGVSSFNTGIGGHDHYNFGFTAEGIFDVLIRVTATHVRDGLKTTEAIYRFNVGPVSQVVPEPSSIALLGIGAGVLIYTGIRRRSRTANPKA